MAHTTEPETDRSRYRVGAPFTEDGSTYWPVLAPDVAGESRGPVEVYVDVESARFHVDLLGIVGSRPFCYRGDSPEADANRIVELTESGRKVGTVLAEASRILGGFGVEDIEGPGDTGALRYVNAGDTYDATLGYVNGTGYVVTSWGDWLESAEREHADDSGEARCPNCGEWTEPEHVDPEVADSGDLCGSCGYALD